MMRANSQRGHQFAESWLRDPKNLPPVPAVIQRAMALLDHRDSSAADVARAVSRDEAIAARILRIVNSAFYGLPRRISTLSHAITLLGFEQVRLLLLGISLFEAGTVRDPQAIANREAVRRHSFACARWAQAIAKNSRYDPVEEAFIAGLLHDVGKVVLAVFAPQEFAASIKLSSKEGLNSTEAERITLGIDHVEIGATLSKHWNFPPKFHDCVVLHHSPWPFATAEMDPAARQLRWLLAIVRVANSASQLFLSPGPPDKGVGSTDDLDFDPEAITQLIGRVDALLKDPVKSPPSEAQELRDG